MTKNADRVVELKDEPKSTAAAATATAEAVRGKNHDETLSGKKVRVTFHEQDGDLGKLPVGAGLNGYAYQIPRGTPHEIPVELLSIFENAVETVYEATKGGVQERTKPRFAYTVHGEV